jgi:hypothetical protein
MMIGIHTWLFTFANAGLVRLSTLLVASQVNADTRLNCILLREFAMRLTDEQPPFLYYYHIIFVPLSSYILHGDVHMLRLWKVPLGYTSVALGVAQPLRRL